MGLWAGRVPLQLDEVRACLQDADICSNCGACLPFCQWDLYEEQNPGQPGDPSICRACMLCFRICPRPQARCAKNEEALFGAGRSNDLLGYYREALAVKTLERPAKAQDGGAVTALLKFMLREDIIEAALLTYRDEAWRPQPFLATTEAEVEAGAGSKYTASPALSLLGTALERFQRLALVGLPCQVAALRNLQRRREVAYPAERVLLTIGLFCTETFTYGQAEGYGLAHFVEGELGIPLGQVTRFDIKKNNLLIYQGDRVEGRPLVEVKPLAWPICHSCPDFTAELADLSVGAVGSRPGENTVLVRSLLGQEVLERAIEAGLLEKGPVRNLGLVERLAGNKRARREGLPLEVLRFLTKGSVRGNYKKAVHP